MNRTNSLPHLCPPPFMINMDGMYSTTRSAPFSLPALLGPPLPSLVVVDYNPFTTLICSSNANSQRENQSSIQSWLTIRPPSPSEQTRPQAGRGEGRRVRELLLQGEENHKPSFMLVRFLLVSSARSLVWSCNRFMAASPASLGPMRSALTLSSLTDASSGFQWPWPRFCFSSESCL